MKLLSFLVCVLLATPLFSQVQLFNQPSSDSKYIPQRTYSNEQGSAYNLDAFVAHPDFGKLPFDAPIGKRVVEDLSKRTSDSRYYIDLDDPKFFYIQQASNAINTYKGGYWRAIDPTLYAANANTYRSGIQPCITSLEIGNKQSVIELGNDRFGFNNYQLKVTSLSNQITLHQANWNQIQVANNGAYITEVFPGIDLRLTYLQGSIKSEFIIKQNLQVKELQFIDQLDIPSNLNGYLHVDENNGSEYLLFNDMSTGDVQVKIDPVKCYDASGDKQYWINPYTLDGNLMRFTCDSLHLNDASKVYPLTIDPLVTVVGPIASPANLMGSLPSPSFCSHTINVNYPGGTTPWDVSASWAITSNTCGGISCYMSEAQVWITSSCGGGSPVGFPSTIWTCSGWTCGSPGNWTPTLPFNSSGTQSLAQCYSPSCSNQNLSFTINFSRTFCGDIINNNCNWLTNNCNYMNNWSVTVQGRSAETLSNTPTGNGSLTIAAPTCASGTQVLNPTPQYGVPGYTYVWSTGATSSTITVPNAVATYTCQVTDACGTVRTATFTITCPLGIDLSNFEAKLKDKHVDLSWDANCTQTISRFDVLRAGSDLQFKMIGSVPMIQGNQSYRFVDQLPLDGINYYQLSLKNELGNSELSEIRSVVTQVARINALSVVPNPNTGSFSLEIACPTTDEYMVELISANGRIFYQQTHQLDKGQQVIPMLGLNLEKGTYVARVRSGNRSFQEKLVVE